MSFGKFAKPFLLMAFAVLLPFTGLFAPTSDTRGHEDAQSIKGAGAVIGESVAVRCVNAANNAFESCAGGAAGGTQDVNLLQLLGSTPGATNPFPQRLSTGVTYYDARDRNWALASGTDSIAAVQSGTWNIGTLTSITNTLQVDVTDEPARDLGKVDVASLDQYVPVSGRLPVDGSGVTQPVSGTITANDGTHTVTSASMNNDGACPSGAANFTVLASNASRKKAYLAASPANTDDVYVKFGVTATSSDFRLAPGQPINEYGDFVYTGQIDAIPASGTQAVCVMEFN